MNPQAMAKTLFPFSLSYLSIKMHMVDGKRVPTTRRSVHLPCVVLCYKPHRGLLRGVRGEFVSF